MANYATTDQFYDYQDQIARGTKDALVTDLLTRATDMVNGALGFTFSDYADEATDKNVWSGNGGYYLYLTCHESGSVTGVTQVASRGTNDESEIEIDDYVVETRGRLYRDSEWLPRTWYRVTAKWGVGPVPARIVEITLEVAVNLYNLRQNGTSPTQGVEGNGSTAYPRALTWAQRSVIESVRMGYWAAWHED